MKHNRYNICMCEMSGDLFRLSVKKGYGSKQFIERLMNSETGRILYDNNSIDVWLGETFVMEDIENHLHPEKGETYSESFMYWAGYLFRCWGITYPEESAQDMLRQAPVETLRKSYVGMHVLFFEDAIQNLKEIYELEREGSSPVESAETAGKS